MLFSDCYACYNCLYVLRYADKKDFLLTYTNVPCWEVPELIVDAMDREQTRQVLMEVNMHFNFCLLYYIMEIQPNFLSK